MKFFLLLIFVLVSTTILTAEEPDSVKSTSEAELEEQVISETDGAAEEDVFLDLDGDGIADDRTFRERMHNWRRTRSMSERIRNSEQDNSENNKFGNKAKQGGQGNGHGNDQGNGNG
jgi:hypothetical protein